MCKVHAKGTAGKQAKLWKSGSLVPRNTAGQVETEGLGFSMNAVPP